MITIRDIQMRAFEQQALADFKRRLAAQIAVAADADALDGIIADARAHGITSERDVARMVAIVQAHGGAIKLESLPKPAQNALLKRGLTPEESLGRPETALANEGGTGEGESMEETRSLPLPMHYDVRDGDCIVSIAYAFGFFTETIWNHVANRELKRLRQNLHVLSPGDRVFIPERRLKEELRPTDAEHRFRLRGVPKKLRIQLRSFEKPMLDAEYTLRFQDREEQGRTDGDGWLEHFIPPGLRECHLRLDDGSEYRLALGSLDPASEVDGVQDRLVALGYYAGPATGEWDAATRQALRDFQANHWLDATGEMNAKTRDLLVAMAGA